MDSPNPDDLLSRRTDHLKIVKPADAAHVESEPRLFLNRELSWLAFNERVLEEARDSSLPLYERLKFIGIVSSNFDEFFMIRVAGLKQQILEKLSETAPDGMTAVDQLAAIGDKVHALVAEQDRIWREELCPQLAAANISVVTPDAFTAEQRQFARNHFTVNVFPALTPLAVDPGHPFPNLRNRSLNIAVILAKSHGRRRARVPKEQLLAVVQVPMVLGRLVRLPSEPGKQSVALLGDVISAYVGDLFPGYEVRQTARFRVTRNSDLLVDEEESEDLLLSIQEELRRRELGATVRLELSASASADVEKLLAAALEVEPADIYRVQSPLQLQDLVALEKLDGRPELRVEPLVPAVPTALRDPDVPIFDVIKKSDVLLHHPYESYDPVVRFIEEAADDPNVLALKMTLYRTSGGDSPFVRALSRAAQNGKQATVLVEIKARFDEANNIAWARRLEENGVHVVYGLIGYKTHCKVSLVVRREGESIRRYVHIGTGNYHPQTARQYTDLSFLTTRPEIAEDASALFNMLTGYCEPPHWKKMAVAPFDLQAQIISLITKQTERARKGEPARIIAKMNSLVDPSTIRALYAASQAGVDIDLLVRGICCLRAGVKGLSERIRVVSVVDRFLEHSRVFAFGPPESCDVYIASADWMPRNFVRRIEVMCPIEHPTLKTRLLHEVLGTALRDNVKARALQPDGRYERVVRPGPAIRSQAVLLETAKTSVAPTPNPNEAAPSFRSVN
ncbi:MAG TPA: polyphosphate kinase 1 [Polyangia bacterium]|nr:polyphosphate kinase 1 [Polyangia bacterium]